MLYDFEKPMKSRYVLDHPIGEGATGSRARPVFRLTALQLLVMASHYASLRLALRKTGPTLNPVQPRFLGSTKAVSSQDVPHYLSSDNDPLFLYHRWQANLRILGIDEIKTVPNTPLSPLR